MNFYFRIDNLHIYDEFFSNNYLNIANKIEEFFNTLDYEGVLEGFYPVIVLRNQKYYKMIEEDPSQIKLYQYYPKTKFRRKVKILMSFVEVHHEDARNANTVSACERIIARAILKSVDNANTYSKQRIDFQKMETDLLMFYAMNGIAF